MTPTRAARIAELSQAMFTIAGRLNELAVPPGGRANELAEEEKAGLRMQRERLALERARLVAEANVERNDLTTGITAVAAPGRSAELHDLLLATMQAAAQEGLVTEWRFR